MLFTNPSKISQFLAAAVAVAGSSALSASAPRPVDALRFFEGRTEMTSTVKVVMKKPYQSTTVGAGTILPDGSLSLVQQIREGGKPARERRWRIRQVAAGRYTGTMTDAVGPVVAEKVGGRYRFQFRLKGSLAVEQWLAPEPGGRTAHSRVTVKKFGVGVASSEGTIRKL